VDEEVIEKILEHLGLLGWSVRPERVEGRVVNYDTVSMGGEGDEIRNSRFNEQSGFWTSS